MAPQIGFFLIASLIGASLSFDSPPELIVWNVGQGQWVTVIENDVCWHLDMGGEFAPWREIRERCRHSANRVSLSHWDMDHIVFAPRARSQLPDLCLENAPLGHSNPRKEAMILKIPKCKETPPYLTWADPNAKSANQKSWVVLWRQLLVPGDSPRDEEKRWIHYFTGLENVRILVLGHHGSRTSTSQNLLAKVPALRVAIASARFRRYRHPHAEVVRALAQRKIPLLRTEEWGTIHMRLD